MDQSNRNFYHSFPRVRPGESRIHSIELGLKILRAIQQIGLVLAPEIVHWKQPLQIGADRNFTTRQCRISFTELSRDEVEEHAKVFGPFSLEVRIDTLRRFGALPVIYIPQPVQDDRSLSSVGATIVADIGYILYMINQLQQFSLWVNPDYLLTLAPGAKSVADDLHFTLQNTDPDNNIVATYQVPRTFIKDFLSHIGYGNAPFEEMIGVLTLLQSLFYPTDDERHDKQLQYYRQREWRLVAGLGVRDKPQSRSLTESEKQVLLDMDERFWSREISDNDLSFRRIDGAQVIDNFGGRPIEEMVSAVIVPSEAYEEARNLFGEKVQVLSST